MEGPQNIKYNRGGDLVYAENLLVPPVSERQELINQLHQSHGIRIDLQYTEEDLVVAYLEERNQRRMAEVLGVHKVQEIKNQHTTTVPR